METNEPGLGKLALALSKAQGVMESVIKDRENPYFKSRYATLSACWAAVRKPLADNELAVIQDARTDTNGVIVTTWLIHSSNETFKSSEIRAIPKDFGPQAIGSCITYLRRYGISALLGITPDEDDDGNAAQPRPSEERTSENAGLTRGAQRGADWLATNARKSTALEVELQTAAATAIDKQMAKSDAKTLTKRARCLKAAADHGVKSTDLAKMLAELGWPDNPKDLTDEQVVAIETTKMAEYVARLVGAPAVLPDGALSAVGEAQARESEYLTDPEEEVA